MRADSAKVTPPEPLIQTSRGTEMPGYALASNMRPDDLGDGRMRVVTTSILHTGEVRDTTPSSGVEHVLL